MLDMLKKKIIVIDPQAGKNGYSNERVAVHEHASQRIVDGFFACVNKFFTEWHCNKQGWCRSFPVGLEDEFSRFASTQTIASCKKLCFFLLSLQCHP